MKARSKTRRWWKKRETLIAGCAVALLVALGFAAKPAYHAFRNYRLDQSLAAAQAAASHGDWTTARDKARSVLMVRNDDFEAFRVWAMAQVKLDEPSVAAAAAQLVLNPQTPSDDRLEAFRALVRLAPQAFVLGLYYKLPKEISEHPSYRAALVRLLIERGALDLADKGLREIPPQKAGPDVKLEMLRVRCATPDVPQLAEARRIFADLVAAKANGEALEALTLLAAVPGGLAPGDPLPDLRSWLKQQTEADAAHQLLGLEPELLATPAAADACYRNACARFLKSDPGALGDWLIHHGQAAMAAEVLADPAKAKAAAYLSRLKALLELRRIPEIEEALASPPAGIDMLELEIMQAKFAAQRGDPLAADAAWTRAMNQAAFDTSRNRFLEIARAAAAAKAKNAVVNAWVAAIRLGWGPLPLYRDLLPVYDMLIAKGRSEDLLAMLRVMVTFEPTNADLVNNFCYLALLHGLMTPGQVIKAMTKLCDKQDKPGYYSTLMLAEMMDGQAATALARMQEFEFDPGVSKVLKIVLEGTARVLTGDTRKGSAMIAKMAWGELMPQEKIVFRDLLVKAKIADLPIPELETPVAVADPEQTPAWRKAIEHPANQDNPKFADPSQTPAWRKAIEHPADVNDPNAADPSQTPAWRKALERLNKDSEAPAPPP